MNQSQNQKLSEKNKKLKNENIILSVLLCIVGIVLLIIGIKIGLGENRLARDLDKTVNSNSVIVKYLPEGCEQFYEEPSIYRNYWVIPMRCITNQES